MTRIYPSGATRAYVVVAHPMPLWRRVRRRLLRRPTADVYPVEVNLPDAADDKTVTGFSIRGDQGDYSP